MCHLLLLLPLLALPVFWVLPLSEAVPVYGVVSVTSAWIYYLAMRAMQRPVETGADALVHSTAEVVGREGETFRVRLHSEIWSAECPEQLQEGDHVEIISVDGLRLKVRRIDEK